MSSEPVSANGIVTTLAIEPGPWAPPEPDPARGATVLVVREGLLLRKLVIGDVTSSELFGPADLLPRTAPPEESIGGAPSWFVLLGGEISEFDPGDAVASRAWPKVASQLVDQAADQISRSSELVAIGHLPRVEDRILSLMWHMADRWGRMGTDGVIVPLALTHQLVGELIGARRPTVSLALRALDSDGLVRRRSADAWWVIDPDSRPGQGSEPSASTA